MQTKNSGELIKLMVEKQLCLNYYVVLRRKVFPFILYFVCENLWKFGKTFN